jgi:hypothetical protein
MVSMSRGETPSGLLGLAFGLGLGRDRFGLGGERGLLFGLQRRLQLSEVLRLLDDLRLIGGFDRLTIPVDNDGEGRHEVDRQAQPGRMNTEGLDRFAVDLALVGGEARLALERFRQHGRRDRAVELARFPGLGREDERYPGDLLGDPAQLLIEFRTLRLGRAPDLVGLFDRAGGGQHRQPFGEQVVAAVAIGDLLDIAGTPQFVDVFQEKYSHGVKPFLSQDRRPSTCARDAGGRRVQRPTD